MKEKFTKKNIIICFISLLLSLYLANFFANIIHPNIQIFIDTQDAQDNNSVQIGYFNHWLDGVNLDDGHAKYIAEIRDNEYVIEFDVDGNEINNLVINGEKFNNYIKISDYTKSPYYQYTYCVKLNVSSYKHVILFVILFVIFMILLYLCGSNLFTNNKYNHKLIYSESSIKSIGLKPIVLSFVVALLTIFLHSGCDLNVISETIILNMKGVDNYQMFSVLNEAKGVTLLMWQYDAGMLAGYKLPSFLTYPFLFLFNPGSYHWVQALIYKLFNMLLMNVLVLSVISFLIDKKVLAKEKAKKLYYLSLFNPVTFYVAIWFIQFDILPAYFMILGILLMDNLKDNKFLSAFLIGFAICCKMTMLMFIPSFLILVLFMFIKNKEYKQSIIHFIMFVIVISVMLLSTKIFNSPVSVSLSGIAQSERIWYTIFPYLVGLNLYVAIALIIGSFVFMYYNLSSKYSVTNMIMITILSFGVITMAFSFGTVSTPSFWLQTLGAFIIMYSLIDDNLSLFMIICFSSLLITQYACLPEGDITASLHFFNKESIFDIIRNKTIENGSFEQWQSLLFTISQTIMFVMMFVFGKNINKLKVEEK
ncbi:MAG: hypothetical protein ACI4WW_05965 [Candidatus Coprovivens sp.]